MTAYRTVAAAIALAALAGCSALQSTARINARADSEGATHTRTLELFKDRAGDTERAKGQVVDLPWIAGKPQPLARDVTLPPALRANINTTLLFESNAADLKTLADRIQIATGILTQVSGDALLPAEYFLPRLASEQGTVPGATLGASTADTLVPALIPGVAVDRIAGPTLPQGVARTKMAPLPAGQAPLASVLDSISLRLGVYWRYDEKIGAIRFYRTETKSYVVRAPTQNAEENLQRDMRSTNSTLAEKSSTTSKDEAKDLAAVVSKVSQFLTRAGVIKFADGASNTIVVTDTKDAQDRIAEFLEAENRQMTRRVRLVFEEITVQRDRLNQGSLDWKILFNSLGRENQASALGVGGMLDAAQAPGSIGATVGSGPFAGSNIALTALSQLGSIINHKSVPMLLQNRRPGKYDTRNTFEYIKDLQQTQSTSDTSAPTVTVTQNEKTVGTFLTVVPDAQDDGQVLLTIAYDDTRLISLKKQPVGSRDDQSFVQQADIGGQGRVQQVMVRPGEQTVIGGFQQAADTSTRRRLDDNAPMVVGGSDASQEQQVLTVVLVTAIPEEGF
ncbi:lipoprotein [Achromobacter xylosoxidans]|nr:lipoprotein [Achromobacter xylosoxidans]